MVKKTFATTNFASRPYQRKRWDWSCQRLKKLHTSRTTPS